MAYRDKDTRLAYAKAHYAANKSKYNKTRELVRDVYPRVMYALLDESESRWLSWEYISEAFETALDGRSNRAFIRCFNRFDSMFCGAHLLGLFMRNVPFDKSNPMLKLQESLLPHIPKKMRADCRIELLILKLTIKELDYQWMPTNSSPLAMPAASSLTPSFNYEPAQCQPAPAWQSPRT